MQTASSCSLRLLYSFKGTVQDEQRAHKEFAKQRLQGEWFKLTSQIVRYFQARRLEQQVKRQRKQNLSQLAPVQLEINGLQRWIATGKGEGFDRTNKHQGYLSIDALYSSYTAWWVRTQLSSSKLQYSKVLGKLLCTVPAKERKPKPVHRVTTATPKRIKATTVVTEQPAKKPRRVKRISKLPDTRGKQLGKTPTWIVPKHAKS